MIRRFLTLPSARRRLLLAALVVLTIVRLLLRCLPFRIVRAAIARTAVANRSIAAGAHDVAWAIEQAVWLSGARDTCLAQALTGDLLLRGCGLRGELRFAVGRQSAGALIAHAWLEVPGGIVIGGRPAAAFAPMS